MHPMSKGVRGLHYEVIPKLQEMLHIKGHLGSQPLEVNASDLVILPKNIFLDNPIHLLFIWQEMFGSTQTVLDKREAVH